MPAVAATTNRLDSAVGRQDNPCDDRAESHRVAEVLPFADAKAGPVHNLRKFSLVAQFVPQRVDPQRDDH